MGDSKPPKVREPGHPRKDSDGLGERGLRPGRGRDEGGATTAVAGSSRCPVQHIREHPRTSQRVTKCSDHGEDGVREPGRLSGF